jgi:hypothetical protein
MPDLIAEDCWAAEVCGSNLRDQAPSAPTSMALMHDAPIASKPTIPWGTAASRVLRRQSACGAEAATRLSGAS